MIDDDHIESKESQSLERAKTEMKEQLFNEIFQKIKLILIIHKKGILKTNN